MGKKWLSSTECDFCHLDAKVIGGQFIDGKTSNGPWALMCLHCYQLKGNGLGLGKGQMYDSITLEKIQG